MLIPALSFLVPSFVSLICFFSRYGVQSFSISELALMTYEFRYEAILLAPGEKKIDVESDPRKYYLPIIMEP